MNEQVDTRTVFTSRRNEQEWICKQPANMYVKAASAAKVASLFGVTPRAVLQWVSNLVKHGQQGLVAKKVFGRPPKLNTEQHQHLAFIVHPQCPTQLSLGAGLWTLRLISALIEREFQTMLRMLTVGKDMHGLGFSPQWPLHSAWEQGADLIARLKYSELPDLRARAKCEGVRYSVQMISAD